MRVAPKVSIIIPTYNSGRFIHKAITSALEQTYANIEIIVVDDGSTDQTKDIISRFPGVIYHYQHNSGVSSARNQGANLSSGKYLLFLDADDWLFSNAIDIHLKYFSDQPGLAFVSGGHVKMNSHKNEIYRNMYDVREDNYLHMLKSNYIGPPAAVMFDKNAFLKYRFNEDLRYSEDYDLYLRISKGEKILHHTELVAAYFIHSESVSSKHDFFMMESALEILKSVLGNNPTKEELKAYKLGAKNWKALYTNKIYWEKFRNKSQINFYDKKMLFKYSPFLFFKYFANYLTGR